MHATDTPDVLTRFDALQTYAHLMDTHFRHANTHRLMVHALVTAGGTPTTLRRMWHSIKHLSWPGTYGLSPWELASGIGYSLLLYDREFIDCCEDSRAFHQFSVGLYADVCRSFGLSIDVTEPA